MYYSVVGIILVLVAIRRVAISRKQKERPREYGPTHLKGQVCIITGASDGIGVPTAKAIAAMGAHVILAVRNVAKGKKVAEEITRTTKNAKVEVMHLELNSFKDVRIFVDNFKAKNLPLNILINNAGVGVWDKYYTTPDGNELQFQVNHLSPFLLTNLLLPTMYKSVPARIVNVSSHSHYRLDKLDWDNLNGEKNSKPNARKMHFYEQSKLAQVLFTHELQRKVQGDGRQITANSLHPGSIMATGFFKSGYPIYVKFLVAIASALGITKSDEEGAWTTIRVAADREFLNNGGMYLSGSGWKAASPYSKDRAAAKRLWEVSEKLTGLRN